MHTPCHLHLAVVRCIIKYLHGTPSRGLFFPICSPLRLVAYSDVDWVNVLILDGSSQVGACFMVIL